MEFKRLQNKIEIEQKVVSYINSNEKLTDIMPRENAEALMFYYKKKLETKNISLLMGKSISTIRNYHSRGIFLFIKHLEKLSSS